MNITATPAVQDALEFYRQGLDQKLHANAICVRLGISVLESTPEFMDELVKIIEDIRKLGMLDQICAEHGITEAVMARTLG